jgi:hypothetical protein
MKTLGDMQAFINRLVEKHGADTKLVIAGFNPSAPLSATEETIEPEGEKVILLEEA